MHAVQITRQEPDRPVRADDIAIVGMDLCLGQIHSLTAFQEAVFQGRGAIIQPPANRWKAPDAVAACFNSPPAGGFLEEVVVAPGEFKIPPGEIPDILPQQLLMLKVGASAMRNAGLPLHEARERMGTIIGISFDYDANNFNLRWMLPELVRDWEQLYGFEIAARKQDEWLRQARDGCGPPLTPARTLGALGGIVASRIAREFRFGGPSFVVSAEEASGLRAVEIAVRLLQSGQTDAMLVGAIDLTCDERNLATFFDRTAFSAKGVVRPFDSAADGTLPGEGAVALVLKRLADAQSSAGPHLCRDQRPGGGSRRRYRSAAPDRGGLSRIAAKSFCRCPDFLVGSRFDRDPWQRYSRGG